MDVDVDMAINELLQLSALALAWWFFVFVYRDYRVGLLRHRVLFQKELLFAQARQHSILDNRAYRLTQASFSGIARFANELTLFRYVLLHVAHKWCHQQDLSDLYVLELEKGLSELHASDREVVLNARREVHLSFLAHVMYTSVILLPFGLLGALVLKCMRQWQGIKENIADAAPFQHLLHEMDAEASAREREELSFPAHTDTAQPHRRVRIA